MSYLSRIIKFALQDFYRNIWLSLVTISILVLTLLSVNVLAVFNAMAGTAVKVIENKVDISVYFKSTTSNDSIDQMKKYVLGLPEVAEVQYISKEENLAAFKETHKNDPAILEAVQELDSNPLETTLRIKARNLNSYPVILKALDKPEFNDLVSSKNYDNRSEMIGRLSFWTTTGEKIVLVFIIFFVLISVLIVFNTVRVAIYTHREEIGVEKLVGATNWFVSLPFIVESLLYGLISCLLTTAITYPLLNVAQPYITGFFGPGQLDLMHYFNSNFVIIFGSELFIAMLLGVVSSFIATRKYLKV